MKRPVAILILLILSVLLGQRAEPAAWSGFRECATNVRANSIRIAERQCVAAAQKTVAFHSTKHRRISTLNRRARTNRPVLAHRDVGNQLTPAMLAARRERFTPVAVTSEAFTPLGLPHARAP